MAAAPEEDTPDPGRVEFVDENRQRLLQAAVVEFLRDLRGGVLPEPDVEVGLRDGAAIRGQVVGFGPGLEADLDLPVVELRPAHLEAVAQQVAKDQVQFADRFTALVVGVQQPPLEMVIELFRLRVFRLQLFAGRVNVAFVRGTGFPEGVDDVQLEALRVGLVGPDQQWHLGLGDETALGDAVGEQQNPAAQPFFEGLGDVAFDRSGLEVTDVAPGHDSPGAQIGFDELGVGGPAFLVVGDEDGAVAPPRRS